MSTRLTKTIRTAVLSLGLAAASAGMASAQQGGGAGGTTGATTGGTTGGTGGTTDTRRDNRGFDWGWLGLIGLAGLIPLFTRRDNHHGTPARGGVAH
jgi:hypothetical protein